MKKQITKHFMAFFLSLVMIMAMGLTAFADEGSNSLTIQNEGKTSHIFELYQIFTGDLSGGTLSNLKWGDGVTEAGQKAFGDASKKAEELEVDDKAGKAPAREFAEALVAGADGTSYLTNPNKKPADSGSDVVFSDLKAGYYLVMDEAKSQDGATNGATTSYIMQVVGNVTQRAKLDVPTVEKKVKDTNDSTGKTSGWQDSADADIGDDVQYQITGTMPGNIADYTTYKYVFTDTMSKGLTYTASTDEKKSFKVMLHTSDNDENGTDITRYFNETIKGYVGSDQYSGGKVITWTCDNLKGIEGVTLDENTKVVITYTAKLNENAVIGSTGNPNKVYLTYSNNPNNGGGGETGKTPDDKNIVFTYKMVVNKKDPDGKPLAGAGFKLEKKTSNNTYEVVNTINAGNDSDGKGITTFEFTGLDDGTYKLTEVDTPAGYNTIAPVEFTISATHNDTADEPELLTLTGDKKTGEATFTADLSAGSLTTDIVNKKGSTLPSTGGRGTTMIYIIGAALVVMAGVVLAMRKKMNSKES